MTAFTDGTYTIQLIMQQIDPEREDLSVDESGDLLDTGCLEITPSGAYFWHDLSLLVSMALDWKYSTGNFQSDSPVNPALRCVWVDGRYLTRPAGAATPTSAGSRFAHERSAASNSLREIRLLCEALSDGISCMPKYISSGDIQEILSEIRRAETAIAFANHIMWK